MAWYRDGIMVVYRDGIKMVYRNGIPMDYRDEIMVITGRVYGERSIMHYQGIVTH